MSNATGDGGFRLCGRRRMPRVLRVESVMPIAYLPVEFIRSRLQRTSCHAASNRFRGRLEIRCGQPTRTWMRGGSPEPSRSRFTRSAETCRLRCWKESLWHWRLPLAGSRRVVDWHLLARSTPLRSLWRSVFTQEDDDPKMHPRKTRQRKNGTDSQMFSL